MYSVHLCFNNDNLAIVAPRSGAYKEPCIYIYIGKSSLNIYIRIDLRSGNVCSDMDLSATTIKACTSSDLIFLDMRSELLQCNNTLIDFILAPM